jgi:hypothetical protein
MFRKQERIPFLTEVTLEFAAGRREARISDLGEGGCYVECIATVRPGEVLHFEIPLPNGTVARASGEVKYVFSGMGFGMRFLDVPDDLRSMIDTAIYSAPPADGLVET